TITSGGNLTLTVGNDLTTQALTLLIENYDDLSTSPAGHIVTGANLVVTVAGSLTADSIDALINNRSGGMIDSAASLIFTVNGALTTAADAGFSISNRFVVLAPNGSMVASLIGSDATILINADNVNFGGDLGVTIGDSGGTIDGTALLSFNVTHDVTVQGADQIDSSAATWQILNDSDPG